MGRRCTRRGGSRICLMLSQHLLLCLEMYHAVNVFCCCSKVHIRWRVCVTDVDNALGFALGVMFVNETFDKKTKPEAEKMIKLITKAFRWKQILIQVQIHFHFFYQKWFCGSRLDGQYNFHFHKFTFTFQKWS